MENNGAHANLVYSTGQGSICPGCAKSVDHCVCGNIKKAVIPKTDGIVRLGYEKNRKGKGVTLITGLALSQAALLDLAKKLKQRFGTGGSVKNYTIELQGDFRKQVEQELRNLEFLK